MEKNILLAFFFLRTLVVYANNIDKIFDKNPNYRGEFKADCKPSEVQFNSKYYSVILSDSTHQMNLYDNYIVYKLNFSEPLNYFISALSDEEIIRLAVLSEDSLYIAESSPNREFRKYLNIKLLTSKTYYLIILKGKKNTKINLSFCSNDIKNTRNINPKKLDNGKQKFNLKENATLFEGRKLNYFDIRLLVNEYKYIKVSINAENFIPNIYGVNKYDEIVKIDHSPSNSHEAELYISKNDSINYVAVEPYNSELEKISNPNYEINVNSYNYNPSNYLDLLNYYFANSLLTFVLGAFLSYAISYFFHRKSIAKKVLSFEEVTDKVLIFEDSTSNNPTSIIVNNEQLYKCCLYEVKFVNLGNSRIDSTYIKEPVSIKLDNLKRIVDISKSKIIGEWGDIKIDSENQFTINFHYIDVGDEITIKIIGEIDDSYYKNRGIDLHVYGKIAEVAIKELNNKFKYILNLFFILSFLINVIAMAIMSSSKFGFNYPLWLGNMISIFYTFFGIFFFFYIIYDNGMRSYIINYPKLVMFYFKKIIS